MKQNPIKVFKTGILLTCLAGTGLASGQEKQSKSYKETFDVQPDAVVDIDVSYADISFETWDKNQVSVEGMVELEGAPKRKHGIILKITESKSWEIVPKCKSAPPAGAPFPPGIPNVPMVMDVPDTYPECGAAVPGPADPGSGPYARSAAFPPAPMPNFDYEAYKKDGDKYMKKWKAEFEKNFDKDYREKLEAWSEEMAKREEERRKTAKNWKKNVKRCRKSGTK